MVPEVIVERIVPRPRTHLLRAVGHSVQLRPAPLYTLAISSTNTRFEVQGVGCLTRHLVHRAMALGDTPFNGDG